MRIGFRTRGRWLLLIGTAFALAGGGAAFATGLVSSPYADANGVYHGCVNNTNGQLRVVEPGGSCRQQEVAIDWNQTGPQGPQGERGPQGPAGPAGPQGAPGASLSSIGGLSGTACAVGGQAGTITVATAGNGDVTLHCTVTSTGGGGGSGGSSSCGTEAGPVPNATWSCSSGVWTMACSPGFADGDHNSTNGCEINLMTDPANCGGLGQVVSFPNAVGGCSGGHGYIVACNPGYFDVDGITSNGCELRADSWPDSLASAAPVGTLAPGTSVTRTGNIAPATDEDWFQFALPIGATATINTSGGAVFDLLSSNASPIATAVTSHTVTNGSLTTASYDVKVHSMTGLLPSYTLSLQGS